MTRASEEARNEDVARRLMKAISAMRAGAALDEFFHPEIVHEEMPNRIYPKGQVRNLEQLRAGSEKGRGLNSEIRIDLRHVVASGDTVVIEAVWHSTFAVDLGPFRKGQTLRTQFVAVMQFRDGKVISHRNYDCYDPF